MRQALLRVVVATAVAGGLVVSMGTMSSGGSTTELRPAASEATGAGKQVCKPTRTVTLFGEKLRGGRIGYGLTPSTATSPGPTLTMYEGECLAVRFVNHTGQKASVHAHGVDYTHASDATPHSDSCTAPGKTRTYVFGSHETSQRKDGSTTPGSAGYFHYHDHCLGTPHGTGGIYAGMFGALIVRKQGDPLPARDPFVVVMLNDTINGQYAPKTPTFQANVGERVEFVVIGHGELFHTFHLHGHRWFDTRTGELRDGEPSAAVIDNKTVGPADSFGFQVVAGEHVGPGAWMYHCHVQSHADFGMSGVFLVRDQHGHATEEASRVMADWRAHFDKQPHGASQHAPPTHH